MKTLVVVVALALVGLGLYRGWFWFSADNTDQQPSATFTVDKDKFREDGQKAKAAVQGLGQETQENLGEEADEVSQ